MSTQPMCMLLRAPHCTPTCTSLVDISTSRVRSPETTMSASQTVCIVVDDERPCDALYDGCKTGGRRRLTLLSVSGPGSVSTGGTASGSLPGSVSTGGTASGSGPGSISTGGGASGSLPGSVSTGGTASGSGPGSISTGGTASGSGLGSISTGGTASGSGLGSISTGG